MAKQQYERQRVRLTSGCTTEGHCHDLYWNNSRRIDMSHHSDTISWFRANQSLLFILSAACLAEKQTQYQFNSRWFEPIGTRTHHDLSSTWDKLYFFIRYPYYNFNKCGTLTLLTSKRLGAWPRTIWSFHSDSVNGHKGLTLDSMHCFYS
jgi:hypothetical protein